jgi:hypothetical protein
MAAPSGCVKADEVVAPPEGTSAGAGTARIIPEAIHTREMNISVFS